MKEEMARPTITKENILCYFEQFRKLNTNKIEHRRRLIDSFVNAIFLYDDKMVITFNYREQTKTITFADLEKSGIGSDINAVAAPKNYPQWRAPPLGIYFCGLRCERGEQATDRSREKTVRWTVF